MTMEELLDRLKLSSDPLSAEAADCIEALVQVLSERAADLLSSQLNVAALGIRMHN